MYQYRPQAEIGTWNKMHLPLLEYLHTYDASWTPQFFYYARDTVCLMLLNYYQRGKGGAPYVACGSDSVRTPYGAWPYRRTDHGITPHNTAHETYRYRETP